MIKNQSNITIDGSDNRPILIDITYKENKKCKKVVVFSHGFKGFKDWGAFNQIAKTFAQNDFIFVKFNFSHNGTTTADTMNFVDLEAFGKNNFCKELNDLGFVLDWVEKNFINVEIYLLGHSRGGGISMLKTAEDNRISKVVSWASPSDFTNRMSEERIAIWKEKGVAFVYNGRTKQNMGEALDLNAVAAKDLMIVPGIGPRLATRIIEFREHQGRFSSLVRVEQVRGIGPGLRRRLAEFVRVKPLSGKLD